GRAEGRPPDRLGPGRLPPGVPLPGGRPRRRRPLRPEAHRQGCRVDPAHSGEGRLTPPGGPRPTLRRGPPPSPTTLHSTGVNTMKEIVCADAVEALGGLADDSVPMTLTSPPYDGIRLFGGHPWNFDKFRQIADALVRVTAPGGVVVWVVQDQIVEGSHT